MKWSLICIFLYFGLCVCTSVCVYVWLFIILSIDRTYLSLHCDLDFQKHINWIVNISSQENFIEHTGWNNVVSWFPSKKSFILHQWWEDGKCNPKQNNTFFQSYLFYSLIHHIQVWNPFLYFHYCTSANVRCHCST